MIRKKIKSVLLIDADSIIPNIALMKLSYFYKKLGYFVDFVRCGLSYYPNKKKFFYYAPSGYDFYFCSIIFDGNKEYIKGNSILFGGTGFDLSIVLPDSIEYEECDYSLYPGNDTSYGFITRGCIRNCSFCKVPKKEGWIRKVNNIDDIVRHKNVKFLDNNILAYPEHISILNELVDKQIKCQFNQGLDIRLVTPENSFLLSKMNYLGDYFFAFDSWKYRRIIEDKMCLLEWAKDWRLKFFVYVSPFMPIISVINRISWLKANRCLPYIMRDISCWYSINCEFYVDIAAYCNQPNVFKKMSFEEFLLKRHPNSVNRVTKSLLIWNTCKSYLNRKAIG